MEKRREVRQLGKRDVIELGLFIKAEVTLNAEALEGGEFSRIHLKPMPCGPACGQTCTCHFSLFEGVTQTPTIRLKSNQRVTFIGNLERLLAQREAMNERIAQIEASYGNIQTTRSDSASTTNGSQESGETV